MSKSSFKNDITLESEADTGDFLNVTPWINLAVASASIFIVPSVKRLNHSFNISFNLGFILPLINNFSSSGFFIENIIFSFGNKLASLALLIINSYTDLILSLSFKEIFLLFSFDSFVEVLLLIKSTNFFDKENDIVLGGISYILEIIIFISIKLLFPKMIYLSKLS